MKSSFKKLRAFTLNKSGTRDKRTNRGIDEIETVPSDQVLKEMKDQYDGLVAAAQSISGSSYDFSRSIHEMASYLVETFGKTGDGDIGNSFSMLAKVQYEISKLLNLYTTHVAQTIIRPTENLLQELESFMEVRQKYEIKRDLYNQMKSQKPKGRHKKGDVLDQQLTTIKEELNDQAKQLDLRFKSLKYRQELSLMTQAARHHIAQVHLFSKGLNSLNAVESMIKQLSSKFHVDVTLPEEEDTGLEIDEDSYKVEPDFLDGNDEDFSDSSSPSSHPKMPEGRIPGRSRQWENSSKSAPLHPLSYAGTFHAPFIQEIDVERPSEKFTPYALPSPRDATARVYNQSGHTSSKAEEPLVGDLPELRPIRTGNLAVSEELRSLIGLSKPEVYDLVDGKHVPNREEANKIRDSRNIYPGRSPSHNYSTSFSEVLELFSATSPSRQGILASTPPLNYHRASRESEITLPVRMVDPLYKSGPVGHSGPIGKSGPWGRTPSRVSPCSSPPLSHLSPPVISELHKLPAPPSPPPPPKSEPSIAHSAPLGKPGIKSAFPPSLSLSAMNSSVTKSRSIPSSINFVQDLHSSSNMHADNAPFVESP